MYFFTPTAKLPITRNAALLCALFAALGSLVADAPAESAPAAAHPAKRGCSRFAAPAGSDSRSGSLKRPFRTPQRLVASLRPGQTGCLRGGGYSGTSDEFVVRFDHGGRPGARITLRSYPGERAKLVGNVEVMSGADYVTLSHLRIEGTGGSNTVKIYAAHAILQDSDITNAWRGRSCVILGSDSYGVATLPIVRRNRFHECGSLANGSQDHGIYAQSVAGGQITGNTFWDSAAYAIQLYPNAQRMRVNYNVIDGGPPSVRGGIVLGGETSEASSNNVVTRNVVAYAQTYNITSGWHDLIGTGNVVERNCLWAGENGNIDGSDGGFSAYANDVANPAFRNRQSHDYRLRRSSRCRRVIGGQSTRAFEVSAPSVSQCRRCRGSRGGMTPTAAHVPSELRLCVAPTRTGGGENRGGAPAQRP